MKHPEVESVETESRMAGARDSGGGNGERFQDESLGRGVQASTGASRHLLPMTLGFLVGTAVSLTRRRSSQEGAEKHNPDQILFEK